jgi:hypothetical protein
MLTEVVDSTICFLWQDNNAVLGITRAHCLKNDTIERLRKRPSPTSVNTLRSVRDVRPARKADFPQQRMLLQSAVRRERMLAAGDLQDQRRVDARPLIPRLPPRHHRPRHRDDAALPPRRHRDHALPGPPLSHPTSSPQTLRFHPRPRALERSRPGRHAQLARRHPRAHARRSAVSRRARRAVAAADDHAECGGRDEAGPVGYESGG